MQMEKSDRKGEQMRFDSLEDPGVGRSVPKLGLLAKRLARRAHLAPEAFRAGAPRVYRYAGTLADLQLHDGGLPECLPLSASRELWGYEQPQLTGDALAQWCLHGCVLPPEGSPFHVFCMGRKAWIGCGEVCVDEERTIAILQTGLFADFAAYEVDAHDMILVFHQDSKAG